MKTKVYNMESKNGNKIANQFEIYTDEGKYFQSYSSVIAFRPCQGKVQLDRDKYDYSRTTVKYRNMFLRMTTKEVEKAIEEGRIELVDLND